MNLFGLDQCIIYKTLCLNVWNWWIRILLYFSFFYWHLIAFLTIKCIYFLSVFDTEFCVYIFSLNTNSNFKVWNTNKLNNSFFTWPNPYILHILRINSLRSTSGELSFLIFIYFCSNKQNIVHNEILDTLHRLKLS